MSQFVDRATIKVRAGNGGDGNVSFRHEKYIAKGGPDGGDGGNGGDVYFQADTNISTLKDFQTKKMYIGVDGEPGGKKKMTGASGEETIILVPVGTLVYESVVQEVDQGIRPPRRLIADIKEIGQKVLVAKGGKGGKGNTKFRSSTNQAPREASKGQPGESKKIFLELKLLADVGLIGFPNAGKSTLLSVLTNAQPEIAGYRFTTLIPNLGVLSYHEKEIVIADIPGLIAGAAKGKGLGDEFLRHVERTKVLLHLIDPTSAAQELGQNITLDTVKSAYDTIRAELGEFSEKLLEKPELVIITKTDIPENAEVAEKAGEYFEHFESISAATHTGLDDLTKELIKLVDSAPEVDFGVDEGVIPVFTLEDLQR